MERYEYTQVFLKGIEEEFAEFLDEFPRSKWAAEAKMRFAKFYLFKKTDYSKVNEFAEYRKEIKKTRAQIRRARWEFRKPK